MRKLNYIHDNPTRVVTNVKYNKDYTDYLWSTFYVDDGDYWLLIYIKNGEKYSMEIVDDDVHQDRNYFGFRCDNYCDDYPSIYLFDRDNMRLNWIP